MANYNDGKWHRWNGESMKPASVHAKSIIEYIWHGENSNSHGRNECPAGEDENGDSPAWGLVLKFRVIKEHREPRYFWVREECLRYDMPCPDEAHKYVMVRESLG